MSFSSLFIALVLSALAARANDAGNEKAVHRSAKKMDMGWSKKLKEITCVPQSTGGVSGTDATVSVTVEADKNHKIHIVMSKPIPLDVHYEAELNYSGHFITYEDSTQTYIFRTRPAGASSDGSVFVFNDKHIAKEYGPLICHLAGK